MHFHEWKDLYFDLNFTEVFPKGPIDKKAALVQAMAWRWTRDKPLSELMLTQFTDAYTRHVIEERSWTSGKLSISTLWERYMGTFFMVFGERFGNVLGT